MRRPTPTARRAAVEDGDRHWQIYANDQAKTAAEYLPLIVAYRNGARGPAHRLGATSSTRCRTCATPASSNGKPSVLIIIFRQPNANIIETVDRVTALLPLLRASIPSAINVDVVVERTTTIRASLRDVERTLIIAVVLVILVVFLFLRNWRATLIPSVAVPVSLIGTFGVMYLCGFSLNNLSLMALTIATGFVVDDAIVVLENISRHIEEGMTPTQAALLGAREVGFTVLSMSLSLIAVFIPILLMGGIVGRLFREFAVTLSVAILISLVAVADDDADDVLAPAALRKGPSPRPRVRLERAARSTSLRRGYERSLAWGLDHGVIVMLILLATVLPQRLSVRGHSQGLLSAAGHRAADRLHPGRPEHLVPGDAAEAGGLRQHRPRRSGGGECRRLHRRLRSAIPGFMFVALKPLSERKETVDQVIARLRAKLANEPGANLFLNPVQDIRVGGRAANAQYQYTLQADDLDELRAWEPKIRQALSALPELVDVNTDQQDKGLQTSLVIDRDTAARLGVSPHADRRDAERRLRPAPGVDDLCGAEPVSRGHGGRARILAGAGLARSCLRERCRRGTGAAVGVRALRGRPTRRWR